MKSDLLLIAVCIGFFSFLCLWLLEKMKRKQILLECRTLQEQNSRIPLLEGALQDAKLQFHVAEEKLKFFHKDQEQLKGVFASLSSDALEKNNRQFLHLAQTVFEKIQEGAKGDLERKGKAIDELFTPVKQHLEKLDRNLHEIENQRKGDQEILKEQVRSLIETEKQLRSE
ncbi:MAG: DNA recombination protein RmuC, partial [Simkania negevensis]|nr:DNA recombination protein RmuC [Simkania negevensis]